MTLDISQWTPHPHRDALLAEVHARPFRATATPARFLRFAFLADAEQGAAARARVAAICAEHDAPQPDPGAKHHRATLKDADGALFDMTFEMHGEFLTYTFVLTGPARPFEPRGPRRRGAAGAPTRSRPILARGPPGGAFPPAISTAPASPPRA